MGSNRKEKNVEILRGDPKKSILRMALPIMVTMIITSLYNVVDGIWIAGLGESAIAGIGIVTPLWMVINGVSNGLAHGATSAISRFGAVDKAKGERAVEQSLLIYVVGAIILTALLLGILMPYLSYFNISKEANEAAIDYSLPLFGGLISFTLSCGCAGILRAEGDTKRPMFACSLGVILNACLDPVFIYTLDMGAAGAAVSTIVTSLISALIMMYWILVKKDTFYKANPKRLIKPKFEGVILRDILNTGIPASMELMMLSLASFFFYSFIRSLGGDFGVSVYSSGYRLYLLNLMPVTAVSLASVAIIGTHYGAKNIDYVRRTHSFCCAYATIIGFGVTMLLILLSHPAASLFALTSDDTRLIDGISDFIKITAFCIPFLGIGLPSTFMYLGLGKGKYSLLWTTINEVVCAVPATYLMGFTFGLGLEGVWWGFVIGRGSACVANFFFARHKIRQLRGLSINPLK